MGLGSTISGRFLEDKSCIFVNSPRTSIWHVLYYTGGCFPFSCHRRKIKHTTRAPKLQSHCKTSPSIFHSTSVCFNKSSWRVQCSREIKRFFSSSASASLLLLPYQSTARLVCVRPLMDFTWQEFGPRQERRALANLTTISLQQGGVEGSLSVLLLMCRALSRLPWVRRGCIRSDKRLAPFSVSRRAYYHEVPWMLCILGSGT